MYCTHTDGVELGLPSNNTSKKKIQIKISNEASELDNNDKKIQISIHYNNTKFVHKFIKFSYY